MVTAKRQGKTACCRYVLCWVSAGAMDLGANVVVWRRYDINRGMEGTASAHLVSIAFLAS